MERYNFTNPLFLLKFESMIRRFFILFCFAFLTACDDGDILTVDLEFDEELAYCTNFEDYHLVYDTRDDPNEALILIFPKSTTNDALFTSATTVDVPSELTINASTTRFIYRTYNRELSASDICAVIPPSNLTIREDYEALSGDVYITSTIVDDDNDGVPSISEYGPGGIENPKDTDGDGIPDYLDIDDDGDNVLTKNELDELDEDGDGDPLTNPLNTDANHPTNSDDLPDYLDPDDDGDEIPTRLEDANGENGPGDDRIAVNGVLVLLYLNPLEDTPYDFEDYDAFENKYTRTVTTNFIVKDTDLTIFRSTEINLGTLTTVISDFDPEDD
ncbi:hypothetical protein [Winogradskyella thalassocola]|uniref:Calcium-binding protein n=1 Tax=Winogradskyella thalassocola TaxID=262004 RepID=A0A1G8L4Y4_9FLAO|nr:hypothetical protein [Winogradskyella thalassocola]SDI50651.1 hypothetical protein SAMN04489796_11232 [Winogradskyella thalassocola]